VQRDRFASKCSNHKAVLKVALMQKSYPISLIVMLLLAGACGAANQARWRVEGVVLRTSEGQARGFVANVQGTSSAESFELSSDLPLNAVEDSFVSGNRLAILGSAGRADAVSVFDLSARREVDRFYCYEPRRISETWIAYVEFYNAHQAGEPTDVVLVYDLGRDPLENRLERTAAVTSPEISASVPTRVGMPVYPEANVRQRSYLNVITDPHSAHHVLGPPFFVFLSSKRLVFISTDGADVQDYHNYIVVVDLSRGPTAPSIRTVEIPRFNLRRVGENPQLVRVQKLEAVSPTAVRIYVPAEEYGVSSFVVDGLE
jgi:hypothetical protein